MRLPIHIQSKILRIESLRKDIEHIESFMMDWFKCKGIEFNGQEGTLGEEIENIVFSVGVGTERGMEAIQEIRELVEKV